MGRDFQKGKILLLKKHLEERQEIKKKKKIPLPMEVSLFIKNQTFLTRTYSLRKKIFLGSRMFSTKILSPLMLVMALAAAISGVSRQVPGHIHYTSAT